MRPGRTGYISTPRVRAPAPGVMNALPADIYIAGRRSMEVSTRSGFLRYRRKIWQADTPP